MPAYHLRTFYLARQSTWGTPTTPNVRLEGVTDGNLTINIQDKVIETIGWNVGNITMSDIRDSEITISLVATYEQILYILHAMFGAVTPIGSSSPYKWVYKAPVNTSALPQLYTIRYGIENNIYESHSCLLKEMVIKGEVRGSLEVELTFISPVAPTPSTIPTVTVYDVTPIYVQHAEFYLSNVNTFPTLTTPIEATLISFEININPNRHIKHFIGNSTGYGDGNWQIEGSLMLEFNSTSKAIIDDVLTNTTTRYLGIQFTKNPYHLIIAMPFIINDSVELFSDRDGNATVELSVEAVYAPLNETALFVEVKNNADTLP